MKKILLFSALIALQLISAQEQLDFTVRYSDANSRYEVYVKPNFTQNNYTWGPSQISVVVPASLPDEALLIVSHAAGNWGDNSKIYAPAVNPNSDFHGVESSGQLINLVANQEKLIFSFNSVSGTCVAGLRLFINNTDPDSSQPGMFGGDFKNSIYNGNLTDVYNTNYNNSGTSCTLSNNEVALNDLEVVAYPNPVKNYLTLSGLSGSTNNIEIFNINGKFLKSFVTSESETKLDFSAYADGIYFVKIKNADKKFTVKKIIKQP